MKDWMENKKGCSRKENEGCGMDSSDPGDESAADTCDHSNELSEVLKCISLDLLSNCCISSSRTQLSEDV